ncbi:MAG: hypothetical protein GX804_04800 [Lentisphaerae bacterium]|nr:hypothetical protein [Lentisphaerota bacterium]
MWIRLQFGVILITIVVSIIAMNAQDKTNSSLLIVWSLLVIIAFILNVSILRLARCPECGGALIQGDSPFRLAPVFVILIGGNPVCNECLKKKKKS